MKLQCGKLCNQDYKTHQKLYISLYFYEKETLYKSLNLNFEETKDQVAIEEFDFMWMIKNYTDENESKWSKLIKINFKSETWDL